MEFKEGSEEIKNRRSTSLALKVQGCRCAYLEGTPIEEQHATIVLQLCPAIVSRWVSQQRKGERGNGK